MAWWRLRAEPPAPDPSARKSHGVEPREITLNIDSRRENVPLVGWAIHRLCEESGLAADDCHQVELATVEAVSNCVRHAYSCQPGHAVSVTVTFLAERLEVRVRDEGCPIPAEKSQPRVVEFDPEDPASIPEGGRGVFLIHQMMDDVRYTTEDGVNVLIMGKRRPPEPA
jgi:serine/threonine-protein kinase RsbW